MGFWKHTTKLSRKVGPVNTRNPLISSTQTKPCNYLPFLARSPIPVTISSPAIFSESIKQIAKLAKADQNGDKYFVLLILTRGIINGERMSWMSTWVRDWQLLVSLLDKTATIEAIIAASGLPMSIIIICVGDNNFESMQELDSDGRLLQLNGKKAQRDIVQAVG